MTLHTSAMTDSPVTTSCPPSRAVRIGCCMTLSVGVGRQYPLAFSTRPPASATFETGLRILPAVTDESMSDHHPFLSDEWFASCSSTKKSGTLPNNLYME